MFGLIAGSFSSFITYRLGEGQDFLFSYSKCTGCAKRLRFYNLIPLLSWYLQKGKCSNCGMKIPLRYPVIELFYLFVFCVIFNVNNEIINEFLIFSFIIVTIFIVMSIIDIEYYFIPISTQVILLFVIALYHFFSSVQAKIMFYYGLSAIIYCVFAYILYFLFLFLTKKEAIGIDDIKLFYSVGLLLGIDKFVDFAFFCGALGILFGVCWQRIKKDQTFPFAPAILTSTFICFIIGDRSSFLELIIIKAANILA